jgi:hypothetical protein
MLSGISLPAQAPLLRRLHHDCCQAQANGSAARECKERDPHGDSLFLLWPCLILCRALVNADRAIPFLELSPISRYYLTDLRKRIAEIRKYTTWNRTSLVAPLCAARTAPLF